MRSEEQSIKFWRVKIYFLNFFDKTYIQKISKFYWLGEANTYIFKNFNKNIYIIIKISLAREGSAPLSPNSAIV